MAQLNKFLSTFFGSFQYFIRNDNLIDRFTAIIQSAKSSLLRYQKDLNVKFFKVEKELKLLVKRIILYQRYFKS